MSLKILLSLKVSKTFESPFLKFLHGNECNLQYERRIHSSYLQSLVVELEYLTVCLNKFKHCKNWNLRPASIQKTIARSPYVTCGYFWTLICLLFVFVNCAHVTLNMLFKYIDTRKHLIMRNVVSLSALLIVILFFCVKTCTTSTLQEHISYDDGMNSSVLERCLLTVQLIITDNRAYSRAHRSVYRNWTVICCYSAIPLPGLLQCYWLISKNQSKIKKWIYIARLQ